MLCVLNSDLTAHWPFFVFHLICTIALLSDCFSFRAFEWALFVCIFFFFFVLKGFGVCWSGIAPVRARRV